MAVAFSDWFSLFLGLPEVLGSEKWWPFAFGFPGLLALGMLVVLPFCPQSPKYLLVGKGEREQAKQVLHRLVDEEEARRMFEALIKECALSQASWLCLNLFCTLGQLKPL